jgi:cytohesin
MPSPDDPPLCFHAARGDLERFRALLAEGASPKVHCPSPEGDRPVLHLAATLGRLEMVRLLLEHGAEVDSRDSHRDTTLLAVIRRWSERREPAVVRVLLEAGADPNARRRKLDPSPLHLAIDADDPELLGQLLVAGADPNALTMVAGKRFGPLHAVRSARVLRVLLEGGADPRIDVRGLPIEYLLTTNRFEHAAERRECVELLIEHGSPVDDPRRFSGVGLAVRTNDPLLVDVLLRAGADIHGVGSGSPPVDIAVAVDPGLVDRLLSAGADPNVGFALETAVRLGSREVVERLLRAGADPNKADALGSRPLDFAKDPAIADLLRPLKSARPPAKPAREAPRGAPLHEAAKAGDLTVLEARLAAGDDPNAPSGVPGARDESTPLHVAATPAVIERLLAAGADLAARNRRGETPLHAAIQRLRTSDDPSSALACIDVLLARGAPLDAVDKASLSPLEFAIRAGSAEAVERLLRAGADPNATSLDEAPIERVAQLAGEPAYLRMFELLVAHGADVRRKFMGGMTILHILAQSSALPAAIRIARKAGVSAKARDDAGFPPREYASSPEIVAALEGPLE